MKHVICVKKEKEIYDDAAVLFTKGFYYNLFSMNETICSAFKKAKSHVCFEHTELEADKFQILLKEEWDDNDLFFPRSIRKKVSHQCKTYSTTRGKVKCISDHVKLKSVSSKVHGLIGREK